MLTSMGEGDQNADVIVAGAGPAGLMPAADLAAAGVRVFVRPDGYIAWAGRADAVPGAGAWGGVSGST